MSLGLLFWVVYLIAVLFLGWSNYEAGQPFPLKRAGSSFVFWLLVGILGWAVFGAVVKT
jgi:TM2 domain-containing membrane protein YozV